MVKPRPTNPSPEGAELWPATYVVTRLHAVVAVGSITRGFEQLFAGYALAISVEHCVDVPEVDSTVQHAVVVVPPGVPAV